MIASQNTPKIDKCTSIIWVYVEFKINLKYMIYYRYNLGRELIQNKPKINVTIYHNLGYYCIPKYT